MIKRAVMPRPNKDKEKVRKAAKVSGRTVLWMDEKGLWHAATDRYNTPLWAVETEEASPAIKS